MYDLCFCFLLLLTFPLFLSFSLVSFRNSANQINLFVDCERPNVESNQIKSMQSYNQLTGSIPSGESSSNSNNTKSEWSNLDVLGILFLDHNQISGTIPYDFLDGLSSSLEVLDLGCNNLVGSLPSALGKMTILEILDVHGNQLTGRVPPEMNRMYPDVQLNLTDNL